MDNNTIATSVIASLITAMIIGLSRAIWDSRKRLIGAATENVAAIKEISLAALRNVVVMWFLLYQIQLNVSSEDPITRESVLLISFWVWWTLFYLAAMLGFIVRPRDLPGKAD